MKRVSKKQLAADIGESQDSNQVKPEMRVTKPSECPSLVMTIGVVNVAPLVELSLISLHQRLWAQLSK